MEQQTTYLELTIFDLHSEPDFQLRSLLLDKDIGVVLLKHHLLQILEGNSNWRLWKEYKDLVIQSTKGVDGQGKSALVRLCEDASIYLESPYCIYFRCDNTLTDKEKIEIGMFIRKALTKVLQGIDRTLRVELSLIQRLRIA